MEPFVQRVLKGGISRERKAKGVDQHFILNKFLLVIYCAALDEAVIGEVLLDAVGNFGKLNSVRFAVHVNGVCHCNRLISTKA